jgi:PhzF family phenazine biosynthesis protein
MKLKTYTIDAFTDSLFSGNPAAVCVLEKWISKELMQNIALENNLSETAFLVKTNDHYEIRWFTPTMEEDLCGHATLASAHVLFEFYETQKEILTFKSQKNGFLKVLKKDTKLFLDFPTDTLEEIETFTEIEKGLGQKPLELYRGKVDFIAVLPSESDVKNLYPNFSELSKLKSRGLIVTAKGDKVDFVSRFFAPQCGIEEDPVTGSAHTSLTPLWSNKLNKKELSAKQLSKRGGTLYCFDKGKRTWIGGHSKLYLKGWIEI